MGVFDAHNTKSSHTQPNIIPPKRNMAYLGFIAIHLNQNNNKIECILCCYSKERLMIHDYSTVWAHKIVFATTQTNFVCVISPLSSSNFDSAQPKIIWLAITRHMRVLQLQNYLFCVCKQLKIGSTGRKDTTNCVSVAFTGGNSSAPVHLHLCTAGCIFEYQVRLILTTNKLRQHIRFNHF